MAKVLKIPSFGRVTSREDDILYDHYCFKKLFALDLRFTLEKFIFNLDSTYQYPNKIKSSPDFELNLSPFSSNLHIDNKGIPSCSVNYSPDQIPLSLYFFNSKTEGSSLNVNYSPNPIFSIRPNFKLNLYPLPSTLSQTMGFGLSLASSNLKGKIKYANNKINGNVTVGMNDIGIGAKGTFNIEKNLISRCGFIAWYKEDTTKLATLYNINREKPQDNQVGLYFYHRLFENIDFVAKITSKENRKTEVWIGNEANFDKTILKGKVSNKGNLAVAFHKKVLPRTKLTVSGEINIADVNPFKFGVLMSFHSKTI